MKIIFIVIAYLISITANAETFRLDSSLNVRSDNSDFVTADDVTGHVSAGTEFEIVSSKVLRSGAKAVEIKVTKLGNGSRINKNNSEPIYIYQNKKTEFKSLSPVAKMEADITCPDGTCEKSEPQKQLSGLQSTVQNLTAAIEEQASVPTLSPTANESILNKIKIYSESSQVQKMISWANKNITRLSGSGKCYRKTKTILSKGQLLTLPHDDVYARNAVNTLSQRDFVNLLSPPYNLKYTPETAPAGAVLVYKSAVKCDSSKQTGRTMDTGCGHIEVKLGDGSKTNGFKYASDYKNKNSILAGATGSKYELVGVMVKLNL